ncbi:MAG: RNA 3'-phosphate cyclase [Candidatus Brocadiae bacterium]|nr:RNA 3'-phosphate cyclase [Candidatus Brocadiia bacterium]
MGDLIRIDGSEGEGGGQILRTSLALSMVTGRPFEIVNLRAGRSKPGLRPQHLLCVKASGRICSAGIEGATLGSQTVRFAPGDVRHGTYRFDVGTAGSTSLVLHTLYLPLALASGRSILTITGGTHALFAPTYHFLERQWAVLLRRIGVEVELDLVRAGFYPRGGGEIRAKIHPATAVRPLTLGPRGELERLEGVSAVSDLPKAIAERQRRRAMAQLRKAGLDAGIELASLPPAGKGTVLHLLATFEGGGRACYDALGARGKRAEAVADEAAEGLVSFLATSGAIDEHAADQLILPLALANGPSSFPVPAVTSHLLTNARVIERFLPCRIHVDGDVGSESDVRVSPTRGGI